MSLQSYQANAKATLGLAEFVSLMAMLTAMVALAVDMMLPALDQIGHDMHSRSQQETHALISVFFVGMAIGQLFFGPFADRFGRLPTVYTGLVFFTIGSLICLSAKSVELMMFGRIVQAFGVSGPRNATVAMIRDIYVGQHMARVMSFIMMVFILVPIIAPMIGQLILSFGEWHYIFGFFIIYSVVAGLWLHYRQPETLPVSQRRAINTHEIWQATHFVITHRQVMPYIIAVGLIFGPFLGYISASQTIYVDIYQQGELFPLYFAVLALSIGIASFSNAKLVMHFGMRRITAVGLYTHLILSTLLTFICWAMGGVPPLWLWMVLMFIDFYFVGLIFGNKNALAMEPLGKIAGIGAALVGALSHMISVPSALLVDAFFHDSLTIMPAGFALGCLAAIGLFEYAGKQAEAQP